ncbi:DUF4157 domain-containing protein [Winogradskyella sp.]|uniref:eCIS core domain-containing protein n=1 Tax=Winogradskyella sp. TaxID=1883156 RepID=UPI003BAC6F57
MQAVSHDHSTPSKAQTQPKAFVSPTPVIQRKLAIGSADDVYEAEADAMADKVLGMSDSYIHAKQHSGPLLQRKCAACEEEMVQKKSLASEITPVVQRKSHSSEAGVVSQALTQQINSSQGNGHSLDKGTQRFMESRFGTDFSGVRIHTDTQAIQMSRDLNAQAFTVGNDIYFNEGKYNPNSNSGKHLLAHELTHTIQQGGIRKKLIQKSQDDISTSCEDGIHDFHAKNDQSCACLVHIHNDERNSKAVANLLHNNCNYNLIDVKDSASNSNSPRLLRNPIRTLMNGRVVTRTDPNEIFSHEVISHCDDNAADRATFLRRHRRLRDADMTKICCFYNDLKRCSSNFQKPVVALHNNVIQNSERRRSTAHQGSTNIIRWIQSDAIQEGVMNDRDHIDRVVWTSNRSDYDILRNRGRENTVLQDNTFDGDTDLSTLFGHLPLILLRDTIRTVNRLPQDFLDIMMNNIHDVSDIYEVSEVINIFVENVFNNQSQEIKSIISDTIFDVVIANSVTQNIRQILITALTNAIANRIRYINIETEHTSGRYDQSLAVINLRMVHDVLNALGLWCCENSLNHLIRNLSESNIPSED